MAKLRPFPSNAAWFLRRYWYFWHFDHCYRLHLLVISLLLQAMAFGFPIESHRPVNLLQPSPPGNLAKQEELRRLVTIGHLETSLLSQSQARTQFISSILM